MSSANSLHYLELNELAALLKTRAVSSVEVTCALLERITSLDKALGSYALLMAEVAMTQAEQADREIAAGNYRGPLHGVPIAVKDLCWTQGFPSAGGMAIFKDFRPPEDATVVRRLRSAGAVLLGKLQMTEGAYSDYHPSISPPKNPWDADYWTGISSSGSGVATAAGLCFGAIASDTGGSIRWPAAANGVTGLKPSWGRVSRYGIFELAPTLDHVGTMARSTADAGILLFAIAGADPKDPTALPDPVPDYAADTLAGLNESMKGLRIGIDSAWNSDDMDVTTLNALTAAVATFRGLGATIVDVQFPDVTQTIADWPALCAVEAAVAHAATYPARQHEYGPILRSVIEAGRALSGTDFQQIILRRLALRGRVTTLFSTIDLLLTPVQPFPPLTLARLQTLGEQPQLIAQLQRYTCPFNMTGNPTLTLPGGFTTAGLPIGLQLIADHLNEGTLIRAGVAFQNATSWHRRHPNPPL